MLLYECYLSTFTHEWRNENNYRSNNQSLLYNQRRVAAVIAWKNYCFMESLRKICGMLNFYFNL
jgi:hypothetical protein